MSATAEAMLRHASSLSRAGRVMEAMDAYRLALARWPDLPNAWFNLAVLQRRAGKFSAALASYQEALDRGVKHPEEVHLNRGVIYTDHLRQSEAAGREYQRALELHPEYVSALLNYGNLHEDLGRRDAARALYERVLDLYPDHAPALARYAGVQAVTDAADPLIERLRHAITAPHGNAADRAVLGFALGRLLDACGCYAAAIEAVTAANRDSRASAAHGTGVYDRALTERFFERLIEAFPATRPPVPAAAIPEARPAPIFVCGMFRSGSTLIEQLLGRHSRVTAGGELDFLPRALQEVAASFPEAVASLPPERLRSLTARYLRDLAEVFPGAEFVTDKRPDNFVFIGLIKILFPHAKIVHTIRDPLDNCLSIFFLHLDHGMSYALDLMDTGHYYLQYHRLMDHWKRVYGSDIVDIDYDSFVREPGSSAERLLEELGLEWDPECLVTQQSDSAVKTASVWQVREPIYQSASGRARHYEQELGALRDYLKSARDRYLPLQAPPLLQV